VATPALGPGAHLVSIGEDAGRTALLVDGVVQSISPEDGLATGGYWAAMLPRVRPRRALILGLGGGTLVRLIQARWGEGTSITGVDDDAAIVETARSVGWLPEDGLELVLADAFAYVQATSARFDYVAVDLFRGHQLVGRIFTKPFLRRVRALLEPRGWLVVNFFRDAREQSRRERIAALGFDLRACTYVGGNVVLHLQRRGMERA
jgi:spermidine synthase